MTEDRKSGPPSPDPEPPSGSSGPAAESARERERERDKGISDFVRRAVTAGMEAAGRSKEDVVRIATTEIRDWLDRLELDTELRKALSKMVLEVKAEVRFRPVDAARPDDLGAETKASIHVRKGPKDGSKDGSKDET
jgi:hypothetical protein